MRIRVDEGSYRFQVTVDDAGPTEELEALEERDGVAPHLRGAQPFEASVFHLVKQGLTGNITQHEDPLSFAFFSFSSYFFQAQITKIVFVVVV